MTTAALYVTISTALYYLVSRAKVTEFAWSRYPGWLEYWTTCAACSGFWYGIVIAVLLGRAQELPLLGLDPLTWYTPLVAGATTMVWTPILARLMVISWMDLVIVPEPDTGRDEETTEPMRVIPLKPPDNGA